MAMLFELADRIFRNARHFKVLCHQIPDFAPVDELIRETGQCFSALKDAEDDYATTIRSKVWRLRATVVFTLLPFNSQDLKLKEQLESIRVETRYVPFLKDRMEQLTKIVEFLLDNPGNPKREKVFELLREREDGGAGVGLVNVLARGPTPGWSNRLVIEIRKVAPHCELISSNKTLKYSTYGQIILPSNGRLSPLFYDLYHACRTVRLDMVPYKREGIKAPHRKFLPKGTLSKISVPKTPGRLPHDGLNSQDDQVDEWIQRRFWESIRGVLGRGSLPEGQGGDRQFLVRARVLVLANNTKVYLREGMKVIEISDLIDGRLSVEECGMRFPRRRVDQLRDGDLIVLRTSGSGDYLIDVADALMKADGKGTLRASALDWKPVLQKALEKHGSEEVARLLKKNGHSLSNHRYVWMWTTVHVIKPKSESCFRELMAILHDLGYGLGHKDPVEIAGSRWKRMKEIIRYHGMAGQRIRQSLLARLREIIEKGVVITDSYRLTLPDVSAGEMCVFRVAGVDPETIEIPYHQAGVIMDLES